MFARIEAMRQRGPLPKPPHRAIKITTAGGKSRRLRRLIASFVRRAKKAGLPHRVLILVPTHKLADEARTDLAERHQGDGLAGPQRHQAQQQRPDVRAT